jgi:exopolysaccharide production protein ExoZ
MDDGRTLDDALRHDRKRRRGRDSRGEDRDLWGYFHRQAPAVSRESRRQRTTLTRPRFRRPIQRLETAPVAAWSTLAPAPQAWDEPIVRRSVAIQHLRAVAVLGVVAYHLGQWIRSDVEVGAAGVDVFFLISGVVMTAIALDRAQTPFDFLKRRFLRVAPPYWLSTLAVAAVALVWPGLLFDVSPQPGHLIRSLLFIPHLNPDGRPFPLLAPGWTLNYEVIFYLAFAAALLAPRDQRLKVLAALLLPLACMGFFWFQTYRLFANPMLLQFLAGALIGRLWLGKALPTPAAGVALIIVALAGYFASHIAGVKTDLYIRPFAWGLPSAALVLGVLAIEAGGRLPRLRWLQRIGDASYSIYLVHYPLLAVFNRAIGPTDPRLFFMLGGALCLGAGFAFHLGIERPMLRRLQRAPDPSARGAAGPGADAIRP